ncbi:LysR substrate-binding domain-containing protein [Dongia deserti]|uniref:LysR substrate-binding domain-containing protein n=1 Tax=Dongia deserti TaxID=2268030 RepID=UPI000E650611|nr:LysR substrate-binding domain-containing protein [Dongia deserti]
MVNYPPFAPLKSFFAAAEASESGRLRAAAKQLGLTESAVSHQIKRLEEFFGIALFERHGRELRLTAAGARFHRAIQPALATIETATADMMTGPQRQRVTITVPTSIAAFWLIPRMAKLQQRHPSVDLQLVATNRLCDLAREHIDLAIRYGAGQWRELEVRPLMPELYFPVASAAFVRKHGACDPAELLKSSRIITNALHPDEWSEWCSAHGLQPPRTSNMITLTSAELVVPAVLDGVGIGMGRRPIIDPLLNDGRLVPLFRDRAIGKTAYYLAQPRASRSTAARKVAEWLVEEARQANEGKLTTGAGGTVSGERSVGARRNKKARG